MRGDEGTGVPGISLPPLDISDEAGGAPAADRATRRRAQLRDRASGTLDLLADMYRDEDWRLLKSATTGSVYPTFVAFIREELQVSTVYARRTAQAVRELVLPIREQAGPAAASYITLTDMEKLGNAGARALVADLRQNPPAAQEDIGNADCDTVRDADEALNQVMRERIAVISAAHRDPPSVRSSVGGGVAAALVPGATADRAAVGAVVDLPWATSPSPTAALPGIGEAVDDAAAGPLGEQTNVEGGPRVAPSGIEGAVAVIVGADPAVAADTLAGQEKLLARAALAITQIRARVLARPPG